MATTVGDDAANAAGNPKATTSTTPSTGPSSPSSKALSPRSMAPKLQGLLPNGDTGSADKAYHVFISYRVKTDAVLAEKLCDKLKSQVVESSSSFKDLRVSVFLDKEELVAGKRFEDQFLNALVSSCLVLPIISADSLALLEDASPLRVDNVLLEWDLTLDLAEAGHVVVIPILVGSNPEAGGYRRFSSFDTSRLADFCVPDTSRSVREIVSTMFAFQGVFVDPSDVSDKIRTIVARLSTEIWPSFRHRWKNATEIAPEAVKRCVQCGEGFKDSENVDGACAFHAGIRWQEYQCCRREKPCVRNKHSATHHNMFPYSAFFDWMQRIIQGDHTREKFGEAYARDFHTTEEFGGYCGAVRHYPSTESDAGKLFVFAYLSPTKQYFMTFTWDEIQSGDPDRPVLVLEGLPKKAKSGSFSVKFSWLRSPDSGEIHGIEMSAMSPNFAPATTHVFFKYSTEQTTVSFVSSKTVSRCIFGERKLATPESLSLPPQLAPASWYRGTPDPLLPNLVKRDPETSFPALTRALRGCPLTAKVVSDAELIEDEIGARGAEWADCFAVKLLVGNRGSSLACVVGAEGFWRYRVRPGPEFGEDPQGETEGEAEWKPAERATVSSREDEDEEQGKSISPLRILPGTAVNLEVVVRLTLNGSDDVYQSRSSLACKGSLLLEVVLECLDGSSISVVTEYVQKFPWLHLPEYDPDNKSIAWICVDSPSSWTREEADIRAGPKPAINQDDIVVQSDSFTRFSVGALRSAVLACFDAKNNIDGNHEGETSESTTVAGPRDDLKKGIVVLKDEENYSGRFIRVTGIVDTSLRRVVAVVYRLGLKDACEAVAVFQVPLYGDALDSDAEVVDVPGAFDFDEKRFDFAANGFRPFVPPAKVEMPKAKFSLREVPAEDLQDGPPGSGPISIKFDGESPLVTVVQKAVKDALEDSMQKILDERMALMMEQLQDRMSQANPLPKDGESVRSSVSQILEAVSGMQTQLVKLSQSVEASERRDAGTSIAEVVQIQVQSGLKSLESQLAQTRESVERMTASIYQINEKLAQLGGNLSQSNTANTGDRNVSTQESSIETPKSVDTSMPTVLDQVLAKMELLDKLADARKITGADRSNPGSGISPPDSPKPSSPTPTAPAVSPPTPRPPQMNASSYSPVSPSQDPWQTVLDRIVRLETRLDVLPGLFKEAVHTALEAHEEDSVAGDYRGPATRYVAPGSNSNYSPQPPPPGTPTMAYAGPTSAPPVLGGGGGVGMGGRTGTAGGKARSRKGSFVMVSPTGTGFFGGIFGGLMGKKDAVPPVPPVPDGVGSSAAAGGGGGGGGGVVGGGAMAEGNGGRSGLDWNGHS